MVKQNPKISRKKKLNKIFCGEKWKEMKRMFLLLIFLLLPKATKHGTFQGPPSLEPSKAHEAWNLPRVTKLRTFHWPSSWGFFSPLSFPFFLKAQIWIICLSLLGCDFRFKSLKTCSYNFP